MAYEDEEGSSQESEPVSQVSDPGPSVRDNEDGWEDIPEDQVTPEIRQKLRSEAPEAQAQGAVADEGWEDIPHDAVPPAVQQKFAAGETHVQAPAGGETPEAEGALASGARAAAHDVVPGVAGAAGFFPGAAAGAAIGSAFPGPGTLIGGIAGGLLGALGAGTAASQAQDWLLKKLGFDDEAQRAANLKEHPIATGLGSVAGLGVSFGVGGAGALAGRVLRGGLVEGDAAQLVGRGVAGVVSSGIDYAQTGDPLHAAAVGAGSGVAFKPTALGEAALGAGQQAATRLGIGGEAGKKFMSTLANAVHENPKNAEAEANPATGATVDGAATKTRAPIDDDVADSTAGLSTPGGRGQAAAAPVKDGIATGETQNTPPRDGGNDGRYAKDAAPDEVGAGTTPRDLGYIPEDVRAAVTEKPPEPVAPRQQAQQEQPGPSVEQRMQEQGVPQRKPGEPLKDASPEEINKRMQEQGVPPRAAAAERPAETVKSDPLVASLKQEQAKRAADAENPKDAAIDAATQKALDRSSLMRQGRQGMEEPAQKSGRQQLIDKGWDPEKVAKMSNKEVMDNMGGGGKPPKPPKDQPSEPVPTERYIQGDKSTAEKAAETVNRGLDNLMRNQAARAAEHRMLSRDVTKENSSMLGKGGEDLHHAIESGKLEELRKTNPKLVEGMEKINAEMQPKIKAAQKELINRGKLPAEDLNDPNYIHRIKRIPFSFMEWLSRDPTGMVRGIEQPDSFKAIDYRGAEAADGSRIVVQDMGPNKFSVWKDGEQSIRTIERGEDAKGFKTGDKFEYNGKEYTADRGTTAEITKHARDEEGQPVRYKEHAPLSVFEEHQQLASMIEHDDMIKTFKTDKALDPYRMDARSAEGQAKKKEGWKELHGENFEEFKGIIMHPDMATAIRNNFDPGLGMKNGVINFMRAMNQFAVRSIFWNPIPHAVNAAIHYVVARGEDWLPVEFKHNSWMPEKIGIDNYKRFVKSLAMGYDDVVHQRESLIDMNRKGAPLVMSSIDRANSHAVLGGIYNASLRNEPKFWNGAAQKYGLGTGVDAVKAVYDASQKILWMASDIMMSARIHELEMKGNMSREQATSHATTHMPDYVLPNRLLGSKGLPNAMADSSINMFGRYHIKVIDSLAHMTMDALGPKSTVEQRRQAFGNIGALIAVGAILYPAMDKVVQTVTGNKKAEFQRRGPMGPISGLIEGAKGEKTYASTVANLATLSPAASYLSELMLNNRDFAGRNIIEPKSSFIKQGTQFAEYTAQKMISPYSTLSRAVTPPAKGKAPGLGSSLLQQVTNTKVPTKEQSGGKQKGEEMKQQQAAQRDKKPRGLIESGINYITPRTSKRLHHPAA